VYVCVFMSMSMCVLLCAAGRLFLVCMLFVCVRVCVCHVCVCVCFAVCCWKIVPDV